MATTKHRFVSAKADGPDSTEVRPGNWNDDHQTILDGAGVVMGRDTSGSGEWQELPLAISPTGDMSLPNSKASTGLATGTTLQRPAAPVAGRVRYNTDLAQLEVYIAGAWQPILIGSGVPVGSTVGWYSNTPPPAWLLVNGDTVGDGTSGATHADPIYINLFAYIWNNLADAQAPVSGGRGLSAAADWASHKTIKLPDERGRVTVAPDPSSSIIPGATTLGATLGAPNHSHSVPISGTTGTVPGGGIYGIVGGGPAVGDHSHSFSATGTSDTQPNLQPGIVKNVIIKV